MDITENNIKPLLLSPVSSPNVNFNAAVRSVMMDIFNALNGSGVNLTNTFFRYFIAVSNSYFDDVVNAFTLQGIPLSIDSQHANCGVQAVLRHIYTNTDQIVDLIELFHNISRAIGIIQRVRIY